MKLFRRVLAALFGVTLAFLSPLAASAAVSYADSLSGYEYNATSTEGRFAGQATGALPGAWAATVDHTPLSPGAAVTGGSFMLATVLNGRAVTVSVLTADQRLAGTWSKCRLVGRVPVRT